MATHLVARGGARLALVAQGQMLRCQVVIKMPDGSCGEHTGLYPHTLDALDRAMDLFPEACVISVCVAKPKEGMQ